MAIDGAGEEGRIPEVDHLGPGRVGDAGARGLPANSWQTYYTLVRAVAPGKFRLPPVHVEAMYNPALYAVGERGTIEVGVR